MYRKLIASPWRTMRAWRSGLGGLRVQCATACARLWTIARVMTAALVVVNLTGNHLAGAELAGLEPAAATRVYLSVAGQQSVVMMELDGASGQLAARGSWPLAGEPGALAIAPDGGTLFVAMRSTGRLASCRIDKASGSLTPLGEVPAGDDPAHISVDPSGQYLLTAYYVAAKVTVHAVRPDGSLSALPVQEQVTADKAHAIVFDPAGRFAHVPHTGPSQVFQFRWQSGAMPLSPLEPNYLQRPDRSGPRHVAWHPRLPVAYINNEQGNSVTAYRMDAMGRLTAGQTVRTLPADYRGENATAEIKMHPNGRWLYVSNRGHDSVARLAVDATGERLTWIGCSPTEATPRSIELSPDGRFLLSAGEASGALSVYRVDFSTGELQPVARQTVGPRLWWVLCVDAPRS